MIRCGCGTASGRLGPNPDLILNYVQSSQCPFSLWPSLNALLAWDDTRDTSSNGEVGPFQSVSETSWKRLLWYVLAGSRGGPNRGRIINLLRKEPHNVNKLAEALDVHYRVAEHHIRALERNRLVSSAGEKYGKLYFLSPEMESHLDIFDEIWRQIRPQEGGVKK